MAGGEGRLRVALADDEPLARETLRKLLEEDGEVELVGVCAHGGELLRVVEERAPQLVFLDIQMPGDDGFAVLESIPAEQRPLVVFVTAYDAFALRAFDVHAIDYLLKPFEDERFREALERAKTRLRSDALAQSNQQLQSLLDDVRSGEALAGGAFPTRLSIPREGRVDYVEVDSIVWVEAADQYVRLHTPDGERLMRESMARLEELLDPERFLRVHRSAIVAIDRIRALEGAGSSGRVLLGESTWIPVSRSRLAQVRARLS